MDEKRTIVWERKRKSLETFGILLVFITIILMSQETTGHVALTFPPARKFDLDFLGQFLYEK